MINQMGKTYEHTHTHTPFCWSELYCPLAVEIWLWSHLLVKVSQPKKSVKEGSVLPCCFRRAELFELHKMYNL